MKQVRAHQPSVERKIGAVELVDRMLHGDRLALSRLATLVENDSPAVGEIMREILPRLGRAYNVGVTGPPGAGKSTLVDALTARIRRLGATVGVVAIDPSSPFSGGAVLGDRIRMQQHYLDNGVFIRSMSSRGSHGGIARATRNVMKLLDAFGKGFVIVETVGVGQTELDIVGAVDTTVVVLVPESGDTIQAMKAGLMEIADIFVVNKADRPGAEEKSAEIATMLGMSPKRDNWDIPIVLTQANDNVGIDDLLEQINRHRDSLTASGRLSERRRQYRRQQFFELFEHLITRRLADQIDGGGALAGYVEQVERGELDSYSAADKILSDKDLLRSWLLGD